jgi:hypothetical protein
VSAEDTPAGSFPQLSGDAAVAAAAERAKTTAARNLPAFDDLPLHADTANLRAGVSLNDE